MFVVTLGQATDDHIRGVLPPDLRLPNISVGVPGDHRVAQRVILEVLGTEDHVDEVSEVLVKFMEIVRTIKSSLEVPSLNHRWQ